MTRPAHQRHVKHVTSANEPVNPCGEESKRHASHDVYFQALITLFATAAKKAVREGLGTRLECYHN